MKKYPILSALFKWLIITAIVIAMFTLILLGLGYLLQQNEKETRELKQRIENNQASVHYPKVIRDAQPSRFVLS